MNIPTNTETSQILKCFIPKVQLITLQHCLKGEEKDFFKTMLRELVTMIHNMPKTYEQDGKGDQATISLHYFTSGCDWYIKEKDMEQEQHQAFGLADIGYGAELGYISIVELLQNRAELDLYYKPRTIAEQKDKWAQEEEAAEAARAARYAERSIA